MVKLRSSLDIQFLELHREYLLLKQDTCSIRVWNLLTNKNKKISKTRDFHPKAFIFYDQITDINNFTNFLTVSIDEINVWSCSNFGDVEIKFKINLPGIQTADCVNVCFSKGIIMTYCNGLINDNDDEVNENSCININNGEESNFIPEFIQASKYFNNYNNERNNSKSNIICNSDIVNNELYNTNFSSTITGITSENELEIGNINNNDITKNFVLDMNSYLIDDDGISTPYYPILDNCINNNYTEYNNNILRKAIYIHSLFDGCKLGLIYCDINDESEDIVLLHYDSDGMEVACGTNHGLIRRYRHSFEHCNINFERK